MYSETSERRHRPLPLWRRGRRIVLLAALICLIPARASSLGAIRQRHNAGLGVSSVEWMRENGGNSVVSEIENWYYTLTAPEKGGPPLKALPVVGVRAPRERTPVKRIYRPPRVQPIVHPALP